MKINDAVRLPSVQAQTPTSPTAPTSVNSVASATQPQQARTSDTFAATSTREARAPAAAPPRWSAAPSLDNVRKGAGAVTLSQGMEGEAVKQLQRMLGLPAEQQDGKFGEGTRAAVESFQKSAGLKVPSGLEGQVGSTTLHMLEKAAASRSTSGAGATVNLAQELASPRSLISRAIGHAEGNLDVSGNTTGSYGGHTDYGNGKLNKGTFSYQHAAASPEAADQAQLAKFRAQQPVYEAAARKAGLDPNNPLLAAAYFDTFTQSEAAANLPGGFLDQLPALAREGVSPENIIEARVRSFVDPRTGRLDAPAFGNNPSELRRDQARRMDAIVSVLGREGKSGSTGPTPSPTPTTGPAPVDTAASAALLKHGASGAEVESLQKQLAQAGFEPGGIDGAFGPNTEAAVKAFQKARGLEDDGVVGPLTRAALEKATAPATPAPSAGSTQWSPAPSLADVASGKGLLKQGMQGEGVKQLQTLLGVEADGKFGQETAKAVASFQKSAGLQAPQGMEGQAGKTTLETLKKAAASGQAGLGQGTVNSNHPLLQKLATGSLNNGAYGTCVATTIHNMDKLGVPNFPGGTADDPNNPRGAMVRMMREANWVSVPLPGSQPQRISSPAYGNVTAHVISADAYEKLAQAGKIPSGALVFQTRHGWDYSGGSSGNDMGIARNGGRVTHNFESMSPIIYGDAKSVVLLVPKDALRQS
jgi:peptidoglycan hydrolase-like protein with peptidoglycan-binding domain